MPEIKMSDEQVIAAYVEKMLTDKGVVDRKERTSLYRILREQVGERLEQAMLMALSEAELVRLNELLDAGATDAEIEELFNTSTADFAGAVESELMAFRQEYLTQGDNAALVEQSDAEYAEFLATAPVGQGPGQVLVEGEN